MSEKQTIMKVDATYSLMVEVGDTVRRGEIVQHVPGPTPSLVAPTSGIIESIQFDPAHHEFIIVIVPAS
jgi:Na+-translocating ferredoxin:NAD+ oxidoreductase RnfC subunit